MSKIPTPKDTEIGRRGNEDKDDTQGIANAKVLTLKVPNASSPLIIEMNYIKI